MGDTEKNNWKEIVRSNYCDLLVLIDNKSGLEGVYKNQTDFYTSFQVKMIWGKRTSIERNKQILDFIMKGDDKRFNAFLDALKETKQESLVENHLQRVKERLSTSTKPNDERYSRSLSTERRICLRANWNNLLIDINSEDLIPRLQQFKILTDFQLGAIQDMDEWVKQNAYMLKLLETGSEGHFEDFCECLKQSQQDHIVTDYLTPAKLAQSVKELIILKIQEVPMSSLSRDNREKRRREINSQEAYGVSNGRVKGRVLVISNEYFVNLSMRDGTEHDDANLRHFFEEKLNFNFVIHKDLQAEEIKTKLAEESKELGKCDIFILFILSHGVCGEVFGIDGKTVQVNDILAQFDGKHCPEFEGRPKLFFIQACRGAPPQIKVGIQETSGPSSKGKTQKDGGAEPGAEESDGNQGTTEPAPPAPPTEENDAIPSTPPEAQVSVDPEVNENLKKLKEGARSSKQELENRVRPHVRADMVVFFATVEGDSAYRSTDDGSHFVRCLLSVFIKKSHEEDVMNMVTLAMGLLHDYCPERSVGKGKKEKFRILGDVAGILLKKLYFLI